MLFSSSEICAGSEIRSDILYKEVGRKLAGFRVQHELSMTDVAKIARCNRKTVSKWEKGRSAPDFVQSELIRSTLGWDLRPLANPTETP